jgi:hypothetical protein
LVNKHRLRYDVLSLLDLMCGVCLRAAKHSLEELRRGAGLNQLQIAQPPHSSARQEDTRRRLQPHCHGHLARKRRLTALHGGQPCIDVGQRLGELIPQQLIETWQLRYQIVMDVVGIGRRESRGKRRRSYSTCALQYRASIVHELEVEGRWLGL